MTLSAEKKSLVDEIALAEGYTDYTIDVQAGSMKGDGYLGIINTIKISEKNPSASAKPPLNLIMKSAQISEKLRETAPVRKAYEREIFMYSRIFSEFHRFQEEKNITHRFTQTPKCYGTLFTEKEESLVLENLRESKFKLWNRQEAMNEEHVALVFATYGKFHGVSLALKNLEREKFEELGKNMKNIFESDDEKDKAKFAESVKSIFGNGFRAVGGNPAGMQAMGNFAKSSEDFFQRQIKEENKLACILHGDCWCNNMMFKYSDESKPSKPTDMRLLDFQISFVGSPVIDLSYFFYACSSKEVLYKLDKFLEIYLESLRAVLEESGLIADEIITMEELKEEWRIYSRYGLFMAMFVMKVILSDSAEAPDLGELADSGQDILQSISNTNLSNIDEVDRRVADVIYFMIERDFIY